MADVYPATLSEDETLDRALSGQSIVRFGDGELRLAIGGSAKSQKANTDLMCELQTILWGPSRALVCIPTRKNAKPFVWERYTGPESRYTKLFGPQEYGSAFISRPDSAPHIDRPDYWGKVRSLWRGRCVILVYGEDGGSLLPDDVLVEAADGFSIEAPARNAYEVIGDIEAQIGWRTENTTVILCLGATATVLAHRLANKGVHALDLGHIGRFMPRGDRA